MSHDVLGSVGVDELDTEHESLSADISDDGYLVLQFEQTLLEDLSLAGDISEECWVLEFLEDHGSCHHSELVAAEGSCVGSGAPGVQVLVVHDDGQGLGSSDGFRDKDDVGNDSGMLEGEHLSGTSHTALNLVADHGDAKLLGDPADGLQELDGCGDHSSLSLDGLEDNCCGLGHSALGVLEKTLEVGDTGPGSCLSADAHGAAVGVGVGHELHAGHDVLHVVLRGAVTGERHGSVAHSVVSSGECDDGSPAGSCLAELDGGVGGVGSRGGTELDLGPLCEFRRENREQILQEHFFRRSHDVQRVEGCSGLDEIDHGLVDLIVVVAECERTRTVEEIEIAFSLNILHPASFGLG